MGFDYLSPKDGPVVEGLGKHEVVYAEHQPQYIPLRTLVSKNPEHDVISRWTLTPEQRKAIADGADIFLILWTHGNPLQPIKMAISDASGSRFADWMKETFNIDDTVRRLPEYQCFKKVRALKIKAVEQSPADEANTVGGTWRIIPEDEGYEPVTVEHKFIEKHNPQPGGYLVYYADGYLSFSPKEAFEEGYKAL